MPRFARLFSGALILSVAVLATPAPAQDAGSIRIGLGDIATVETLNLLIALERVKERGVDVELTAFKDEDVAAQAVVNGQVDIGVGTPYGLIQKVEAPIRLFYQLSTLKFYPVVDKEDYPDWQAMDGQPFVYHGRASGTEAMGNLLAEQNGIQFGEISYVPGSEVRAIGLLQGTIKATLLDITNKNMVMREAPDQFHILPVGEFEASDEALYARQEWLEENAETVQVLVEELLGTWREINQNPEVVADLREQMNLLPDLPAELEAEIDPYFQQAVTENMFPDDGGADGAAQSDFDFYTKAGQIEGSADELQVENFWYLDPLEQALATLED